MSEIQLSRTTKFIVDNRGRTAPTVPDGIKLIATNCINNKDLYPTYENLRYISQETYDTWFRAHPEPGDIILTLKGSQNGAVCLVPEKIDFAIAQDMVALRVDESIIYPLFLFAALRSNDVQSQIKNLDVSGVIPHLKKTDFDKLILPYPKTHVQKYIGDFYFNFSKKIELLHRQNATLELIAETLFRQWFVVEAKEEWEEVKLESLINIGSGKSLKKDFFVDNGLYPVLGANGKIGRTNEYLYNERLIFTGRVGTLGNIFRVEKEKVWLSDNTLVIKPNNYFNFIYFVLKNARLGDYNVGSTQPLIRQSDIKEIEVLIPSKKTLESFEEKTEPLFNKINSNQSQIRTLTTLRDTLLPKLMSGEVRVAAGKN